MFVLWVNHLESVSTSFKVQNFVRWTSLYTVMKTSFILFYFFWTADRTVLAFLHSKNYKTRVPRGGICSKLGFKPYFILPSVTALWEFTVLWEIRMILIWCIFIRGKIALFFMPLSSFLLQNWCGNWAGILSREAGTCACHQTWLVPTEGWTFWGLSKFSCYHTQVNSIWLMAQFLEGGSYYWWLYRVKINLLADPGWHTPTTTQDFAVFIYLFISYLG